MIDDVLIRPASLDDAGAIAELTRELGYESTPAAARERLTQLLTSERDAVFVAVIRERPVGWLHVLVASTLESEDFAEIRGLVVGAEQRGGGIGARLVAAAEEWGRGRGTRRMRVRSNVVREAAHRFYERHGYRVIKSQKIFDKAL